MKAGLLRAAELCEELTTFEPENTAIQHMAKEAIMATLIPLAARFRAEAAALPEDDESLRRDAERYRWLRSASRTGSHMVMAWKTGHGRYETVPVEDGLDAVIDAARRET